jgi:type II secretory pathway component PulM
MSEVMAQARADLAEREQDITSALQHNRQALASLRQQAEDAKVLSPVVPPQPTIVGAAPGSISSRLHPR